MSEFRVDEDGNKTIITTADRIKQLKTAYHGLLFSLAGGKASEIRELGQMEVFKFYRFVDSRKLSATQKQSVSHGHRA